MLRHPRWPWDVILRPALRRRMPSYGHYPPEVHAGLLSPAMAEELRVDPALTGRDFRALCLKGGLFAEGADAIVVSTHGGRSFDGLPLPAAALPRLAANPRTVPELLAESGVRRGSCVLKHRALGGAAWPRAVTGSCRRRRGWGRRAAGNGRDAGGDGFSWRADACRSLG
ncbi:MULTISPECIES: alpha-hydroxy-acid oxidizing protein [Paracoccus]|uniref:alpha-hydroxy-acid oxidizing protein n=1 Tax=Paracoccus TaxID=265 RepID=UPI001FB59E3C|nr:MULTISPECIES: alpha-hydroxy-acid oxidizing protein [Paracoccus]MCJ1902414.1 alpha-hydroxy-acid oxidizing protein [Paracoccus versutus]MDF3907305.1 alpha-hydroxy-acid oxidizing protein [Paracoccus sp. AS002]